MVLAKLSGVMIGDESSNGAKDLLLVGTLHHDPDGIKKSLALLEDHQPDLVLVELSPYGCWFRHKYRRQLRKTMQINLKKAAKSCGLSFSLARNHYEIKRVRSQIAFPFEYRAAISYASRKNVSVALVDSSSFSRKWIAAWSELICADNLKVLLGLSPTPPPLHHLYEVAKRRIEGQTNPSGFPAFDNDPAETTLWVKRERYMAEQIVRATRIRTSGRVIFIGGWWHLTHGGEIPTVRELLGLNASNCLLL